jgi:hypothetical protein
MKVALDHNWVVFTYILFLLRTNVQLLSVYTRNFIDHLGYGFNSFKTAQLDYGMNRLATRMK